MNSNAIEIQQNIQCLYPTPGFVLRATCANGNKLFVNVGGHFEVSDVISTQAVQGCPYVIDYAADPSVIGIVDSDVLVHHAIIHPKYIFAAIEDPAVTKLKVNTGLVYLKLIYNYLFMIVS